MHYCQLFYNPIVHIFYKLDQFQTSPPGAGFNVSLCALRTSDIAGEWQIKYLTVFLIPIPTMLSLLQSIRKMSLCHHWLFFLANSPMFEWFANSSIADCRFQSRSLLTIDYSTIATGPHMFGKTVREFVLKVQHLRWQECVAGKLYTWWKH